LAIDDGDKLAGFSTEGRLLAPLEAFDLPPGMLPVL